MTPTNPQYDNRLFIELQIQYMKIPSSNLGRTCCVQKLFLTFRTIFVHSMFCKKKSFWQRFTCNRGKSVESFEVWQMSDTRPMFRHLGRSLREFVCRELGFRCSFCIVTVWTIRFVTNSLSSKSGSWMTRPKICYGIKVCTA